MHETLPSFPRAMVAAALRGDDALARAAADAAAPRRRLVGALRDAHAEAALRIAALRGAGETGALPIPRPLLARLLAEAEEQLRRLETAFAHLPTRPGGGLVGGTRPTARRAATPQGPRTAHHSASAMAAEERRGAGEARALRNLAHLAGQHLAARLLDLTAEERAAAARDIDRLGAHS